MSEMLFAGLVLLAGGSLVVWTSLRGRVPGWRGRVLSAAGLILYGALIVSGVYPDHPMASAAVWFVAVMVFAGLFISIRDRRRARQAH